MKDVFLEYLNCVGGVVVAINPEQVAYVAKLNSGNYEVVMSNGTRFELTKLFAEQFCKAHGISVGLLK